MQASARQVSSPQPSKKPRPEGWFKVNVDAAIKSRLNDNCVGLGIAL